MLIEVGIIHDTTFSMLCVIKEVVCLILRVASELELVSLPTDTELGVLAQKVLRSRQ